MAQNDKPSDGVVQNNQKLLINSIIIICVIFICLSFIIIYFKFLKGRQIGLSYILTENLLIFIMIGILEFTFFWYVIQKYIPLYPQTAEITVLKRLISYLQ